jgi:hypothetical protein
LSSRKGACGGNGRRGRDFRKKGRFAGGWVGQGVLGEAACRSPGERLDGRWGRGGGFGCGPGRNQDGFGVGGQGVFRSWRGIERQGGRGTGSDRKGRSRSRNRNRSRSQNRSSVRKERRRWDYRWRSGRKVLRLGWARDPVLYFRGLEGFKRTGRGGRWYELTPVVRRSGGARRFWKGIEGIVLPGGMTGGRRRARRGWSVFRLR